MNKLVLVLALVIGMIATLSAQDKQVNNDSKGYAVKSSGFDNIDSAETYTIQVNLSNSFLLWL